MHKNRRHTHTCAHLTWRRQTASSSSLDHKKEDKVSRPSNVDVVDVDAVAAAVGLCGLQAEDKKSNATIFRLFFCEREDLLESERERKEGSW